ncbi:unnamed protein product [Musa acuminata subsp. malaccensis]|uniref:(wild Malaysian banana) hypothetical protein n=1 Tax=Musa acuminata subsp. malaccensis TaxID=214687 RepID=A0A804J5T5_MUSAM|nr:unnamed protein product [Musa acuminata subsp. malaccensis]
MINAVKFLIRASDVGSISMPAILRHSNLIETGAELIEFTSFFILVCMALCFHPVSLDEIGAELPRDDGQWTRHAIHVSVIRLTVYPSLFQQPDLSCVCVNNVDNNLNNRQDLSNYMMRYRKSVKKNPLKKNSPF